MSVQDEERAERQQKVDLDLALRVVNEQSLLMQRAMVSGECNWVRGCLLSRLGGLCVASVFDPLCIAYVFCWYAAILCLKAPRTNSPTYFLQIILLPYRNTNITGRRSRWQEPQSYFRLRNRDAARAEKQHPQPQGVLRAVHDHSGRSSSPRGLLQHSSTSGCIYRKHIRASAELR